MSERPRDWDREMNDVDRVIAKQGPTEAPVPDTPPPPRRRSVATTWLWTLLAVGLAVALAVWPYRRACGLELTFFLGATGLTLLAGVLGAVASWANRRGLAHVISLAVVVWAGVVAAGEVLPRIGYAAETRSWLCPVPPPTAVPQPAPAPAAP